MDGFEFLTTVQVAKRLGVSRERVRQLRYRKQDPLPAVQAGRLWLYPLESVETFIKLSVGAQPRKREIIVS